MIVRIFSFLGATLLLGAAGGSALAQSDSEAAPQELSPAAMEILCERFPLNSRCEGKSQGGAAAAEETEASSEDVSVPSEDMDTSSEDVDAPSEDMDTSSEDVGAPSEDLDASSEDVITPPEDTSAPSEDMSIPEEIPETQDSELPPQ